MLRIGLFILAINFCVSLPHLCAELPTSLYERLAAIGKPISLEVEPKAITLSGPRANLQLLVTGRYADGTTRDLTQLCEWKSHSPDVVAIAPSGLATGHGYGKTIIDVRAGDLSVNVPVGISGTSEPSLISFRREFMPLLSSAGCSDIRCHGAPSGKH